MNTYKKFQGKKVKIITKKNAIYSGRVHISSDQDIMLCDLVIYYADGNYRVSSKHGEKRKFKIEKIKSIEEII